MLIPTEPLRILHVFGRLQRAGAEMRTVDLMPYIDRRSYQLHFCALSGLPGDLDATIVAKGGVVHRLAISPGLTYRFIHLLCQERFHVVHTHIHYASGLFLRLAAHASIPIRIVHFRGSKDGRGDSLRRRIQRTFMKSWIERYATHILAVSESTMSLAWKQEWKRDARCKIVYNGLDLSTSAFAAPPDPIGVRREFKLPSDCPLFIHVGRISPEKNHKKLIIIFSKILEHQPSAYLLLVGQGEKKVLQSAKRLIADLNVTDRVIFAGLRSDVPRLLGAADLLIFPSLWEGLPGVVLESCAVGTPVLASDLPGIREIAEHLPLVHYCSLEDPDEKWVAMALALYKRHITDKQHWKAAMQLFNNSVFNIAHCAKAICEVWNDPNSGKATQYQKSI